MNNLELVSKVYNTLLYNIDDEIRIASNNLITSKHLRSGNRLYFEIVHLYDDLEKRKHNSHMIDIKIIEDIQFKNNIELYNALKYIESKVSWLGFIREIISIVTNSIIMSIEEK
jgi:hypothetical protein